MRSHRSRLLAYLLLGLWAITACDVPGTSSPPKIVYVPPATVYVSSPTSTAPAAPTAPPTDIPTPAPPPTIVLDTAEIKNQLREVEADTATMRGLKPRRQVPEHFISQAEMKYNMTQSTLKEYTPEKARRDATRLWLLLLIDNRATDFREMEIEFAGQEVLGYYDHISKELFVRTDGSTLSPASRETLAHEYVHSLQDQYYDLPKLLPSSLEHDQEMAVRALVEGDATVSGILYASRYMSGGDFAQIFQQSGEVAPPVPGRAPVYLQQGWQFPYSWGSNFILSITQPGSYKPVNDAFANPPRSTEQIMHPEKYLSKHRDDPLPVQLPKVADALGPGWAFAETDTLGEFDLQVMLLENYVKRPEASEGWGGARYDLYTKGDNDAVAVMGSRWDTARDASEWEDALTQSFKLFHKEGSLWSDRGRSWGMKRSGDMIMFVSGTDPAAVTRGLGDIKP